MASITTLLRKKFSKRRDGQIQVGGKTIIASTVVTSSVSPSADLSTVVLKAGDTMTGDLEMQGAAVLTDTISEKTAAAGVTIDGVKLKDSQVTTDVINEKTAAAGVTIDGVLLKDDDVTATDVIAETIDASVEVITDTVSEQSADNGVTIDGVSLKDFDVSARDIRSSRIIYTDVIAEDDVGSGVTIDGVLLKDNNIETDQIQSKTAPYVSGFTGTGFQLASHTECDDLIVRNSLYVYEFIINKIRATNGSLWVSDSCSSLTDMAYDGARYYFTVEEFTNTFVAGDIIIAQAFTGKNVYSNVLKVYSVTSTRVTCTTEAGATVPSDQRGTEGMDFVRIGNTSDSNRQGSIYLTASDSNAPFVEVLDGMTSSTIAASNRKARLGKLNGLTFDGDAIGGYGLWSDSAFLEGTINAISGKIAEWTIEGSSMSAVNAGGDMVLDGADSSLTVRNAGGTTKVRISPESIPVLSAVGTASTYSKTGADADQYTDVYNYPATGDTINVNYYLNKYTTSSSYLDLDTAVQAESLMLDTFTVGLPYATVLTMDSVLSYTIPTDETDQSDGTTTAYSFGGHYDMSVHVTPYSNTGAALTATQSTWLSGKTTSLDDFEIFNKTVTPTTASIYFKVQIIIDNYMRSDMHIEFWSTPAPHTKTGEIYTSQSLTSTFKHQIESLVMIGSQNQVQIGDNGLSHYKDISEYFWINEDDSVYIQTNGTHRHGTQLSSKASGTRLSIFAPAGNDISTSYDFDGAYALNANGAANYAAGFFNDGNLSSRGGILIRHGEDSPTTNDCVTLRAEDGNGSYIGSLYWDTAGFRIYSVSDSITKKNIRNTKHVGLDKIRALRVRDFNRRVKDAEHNYTEEIVEGDVIGFIAQEVEEVIPEAVKSSEESTVDGMKDGETIKGISVTDMIPYLVKAVQELSEETIDNRQRIKTLEDQVVKLHQRLQALEN